MDTLIAAKVKSASSMLARVTKLDEQFAFIVGNARPDFLKSIKDNISSSNESVKLLATRAGPWEIASAIGTIDNNLRQFRDIVESFAPGEIKTVASHTYVLTTQSDMDSFIHAYKMYTADSTNDQLYSSLAGSIKSIDIAHAEREYKKYPAAAIMYAYYLTMGLGNAGSDPNERREFELALERAKDSALGDATHRESEDRVRKMKSLTWPLQRFSLVPAAQHLGLADILAHFGTSGGAVRKVTTGDELTLDKFIAAFKIKKINVLVLEMITGSAIGYDISRLTAASTIALTAGVSVPVLERYNTVRKYDADAKVTGKFTANFTSAGPLVRKTVVIRAIDRPHGPYYDIMRVGNSDDEFVDISVVEKILRGPSSRIDTYQKIQAETFAKAIMAAPLESEAIKKTNKLLIQDLVNRITGRIIQYVDTSLVPLPENPRDLEAAISDPRFVEIMTEEFLKSYRECGVSPDTPADEMLGTFISDLESSIIIQFSRSIKLNMIELGPGPAVFRDYRDDALRTRLYNIVVDVIKRSVSSSILTKENVYEKILIKDEWLATLKRQLSKANDK